MITGVLTLHHMLTEQKITVLPGLVLLMKMT